MITFPLHDLLFWIAVVTFTTGFITLLAGIIILVVRVSSKAKNSLSTQTAQLAEKSIADDLSGLIGNASTLLDSMNQLVRTTTGIGVFLCCLGLVMMVSASLLLYFLQSAL
jgi:hypothetical protein